jgi:hypothetical protein
LEKNSSKKFPFQKIKYQNKMSASIPVPKKNNPKTDFTLLQMHFLVGPFALCREDRKLSKVVDMGEDGGCKIELHFCPKCRLNNKEMSYKMRYLGQSSSSSTKTDESTIGQSVSSNIEAVNDEEMKE